MTIPNLISIGRLLGVPVLVWAMIHDSWALAFWLFVIAGVSDAVDGAIARTFQMESRLGRYLDPIADKALLISVFCGLGLLGSLPDWLVVAVVSRDLLIVTAVVLSFVMDQPIHVDPLFISKATTAAQIVLAATALAELAFSSVVTDMLRMLVAVTAVLTAASAATYLVAWLRHMATNE